MKKGRKKKTNENLAERSDERRYEQDFYIQVNIYFPFTGRY